METLSFKITSDHFLLCVFLSLLWGVTDSTTTSAPDTMPTATVTSATEAKTTTAPLTSPLKTSPTTIPPPENVKDVTVVTQNESSITLKWDKVNNILTYFLEYDNEGSLKVDTIIAPVEGSSVTHVVSSLTAGRRYDFTLITASEGGNSSGHSFQAVTAPPNAEEFKSVDQNETSITLQWKKVNNILNYRINFSEREINVTASEGSEQVTQSISELRNGTEHIFTLFTVFHDVKSSGVNTTAFTVPHNAEEFKSVGQNETSITLQWKKVDNILNYKFMFNEEEKNVTASDGHQVTHTVLDLTSMTEYNFTLFTVLGNVRSSGVSTTAFTAPPNAEEFKSVGQNETSITLQWKKVDNILNYILLFNEEEKNVTASNGHQVTHTILDLTSMTEYSFTLFTVFENVRSSGANTTAFTAPPNAEEFKSVRQNETSITLQWKKVDDILNYILLFNEEEKNVTASNGHQVTHTILDLTSMTEYSFTLFTVFENVRSSGANTTAFTAPENVKDVRVLTRNESSITLVWYKVNNISTYFLQYDNKEDTIGISHQDPSVTHVVSSLTAGRRYNFTLITEFEGLNSTGHRFEAVTAPPNAEEFKSVRQNETSITLQWKKVDDILNYILLFNEEEKNVTASNGHQVTHTILDLTSMTEYSFTLFTVFENVRSSGANTTAFTAPENVKDVRVLTRNESSITLVWYKVNNISKYFLQYDNKEDTIGISHQDPSVTHVVSSLTAGRRYNFTLITEFEGLNSTGHRFEAVTAPRNTEEFKSVEQNETSITLQWKKVDDILNYILAFSEKEINVTASARQEQVTHTIPELTSGTKYNFTLFTVFENVRSRGVSTTAFTAPRNTEEFKSVEQNETSITLQWKKVDDILNYILAFSEKEINVTASARQEQVTHTIPELTSGTKYDFTLFTVFENVRSSGVNHNASTAPRNAEELESVGQNETSITLQWKKVDDILKYTLVFSEREINVTAPEGLKKVTYTILELTSGTKYDFSLFTVFENVRSSGLKHSAATAPGNVKNVTVLTQNESSVTLMWDKVNNISTYFLQYDNNGSSIEVKGNTFYQEASVIHEVSSLNAGTKYHFTLITWFEKVNSTGFSFNTVTVPSMVAFVNVTERSVTSITLMWQKANKDWEYSLQIDGGISQRLPDSSLDVESRSVTSLQPGTQYTFSVITVFSGLNSTAYKGFTVTAIDCASVTWHVTTSSIQGMVDGLFSNATATNKSQTHVSHGGSNVSFDGLYPGATYEVSLVFEKDSISFQQCSHNLTIIPPYLNAHCEYWAAGYSVFIVWNKPDGVWTSVEVNVMGETYPVPENGEQHLTISGFLPARTYEVSLVSLSGTERRSKPFVFQCPTDPRGVIAGSVLAVLLFGILICLAVFIFLKRPDIISRKKKFIGGSKQANKKYKAIHVSKFPDHFYQLSADENRGFSQEYESLSSVGTEQTRKTASLLENKTRNRFNNVQPYDWCRVKLTTSNPNGGSDYINASYMPGYNSNREYIATQGPLPSTVDDFWRMVWEQRVKGIVMVTNCTEGGRTKCERYWPADSQPCPYGELLVTTRSEQQEPNWTLREFRVKNRNNSEERTVKHFHFTAWPDHGVPQGTDVLIQFRGLVRQHIEREEAGTPTVVHCSAGVGRTGTIIALDVLIQQLEKERAVGINGFVHKMRLNRPYMVQTESQYVFLHQCIMDCLHPNEKTEENIYENADMIYVNATALRELR